MTAIGAAAALGVEWIEFDVQRVSDGRFVVAHDAVDESRASHLWLGDAVDLIAEHGVGAHVDLKFTTSDGAAEVEVARVVVEALGAHRVVITTTHDASVRAVRMWADRHAPSLPVGLSLGRGIPGINVAWYVARLVSDLFPDRRFRRTGATMVVAQRHLARLRLARFARRAGLPLLVWTVDSERELVRWLGDPRVNIITTNVPGKALALRNATRGV
ncbi:hypothetical protein BH09ACT10_BH09ACT10_29140 [soil metagenome]